MPHFSFPRSLVLFVCGVSAIGEARPADLDRRAPPPPLVLEAPLAVGGFYFGGRQMLGVTSDTQFRTGGGATTFDTQYELGRYTGMAAGYAFGSVLGGISPRLEIEGSFGSLSVDKHTVTTNGLNFGVGGVDSTGDLRTTGALVNGYLDANLGRIGGFAPDSFLWRIKPFVGAGVGATHATLRRQGASQTGVVMDDSDTRMTWQVSAGLGVQLFERTTLDVGFRHQRTDGLSFTARDGTGSKTDLVNNLVTVGVRRSF